MPSDGRHFYWSWPVLTEWKRLRTEWIIAKAAYENAVYEIDQMVERHFTEGGPMPTKQMADIRDDLLFHMSEARGLLDQFMEEHSKSG